jgi:PAS domain-containing protein
MILYIETTITNDIEAGIFTWSLAEDRIYADTAIAALFGLKPDDTIQGRLPLSRYIDRVHADDRRALTALIAKAVQDGQPHSSEYRVQNASDAYEHVMTVGRCFRNPDGNPSFFSGIVYPVCSLS